MEADSLGGKRNSSSIRHLMAIAGAVAVLTAAPASAGAAPAVIGQVPAAMPPATCNFGPSDILQQSVGSGAGYVVPAGYSRLTSWSTFAAAGAGQTLTLKVFRKIAEPDLYRVVGRDGPRPLTPSVLNTFALSLPVQPGDVLGLNDANAAAVNNACVIETGNAEDVFIGKGGTDTPEGADVTMGGPAPGFKLNVSATVMRAATIGSIQPSSGPITGGTIVAIGGLDFTGATAVAFGSTPAAGFTVNNDGSITAISPVGSAPGTVSISVTNPAGQSASTAAGTFTYTQAGQSASTAAKHKACIVPKLRGRKVRGARKALRRRGCSLGRVRGKRGGRVHKQTRKAGTVLAPGSKVGIVLRKRKRR